MFRRMPIELRMVLSQLKLRSTKYILKSPIIEIPVERQGVLKNTYDSYRVWLKVVSSVVDRPIEFYNLLAYDYTSVNSRSWTGTEMDLVKIGPTHFLLRNFKELRVRPYPDEEFFLEVYDNDGLIHRTPFYLKKVKH